MQAYGFWQKNEVIFTQILEMKKKARIVFMGTPAFATASLKVLHEAGHDIAAVVTAPDKPAGRGQKMQASDVKKYALEHGIQVLQPEKLKDTGFLEKLKSLQADLFVVVAFRILPKEVWCLAPLGCFNLHGSLLPQYRGAAPINHAIMNGETLTGVTTFLIDEAIDTGKILLRKEEPIYAHDTAGSLHDRLMQTGARLVLDTVDLLLKGNVQAVSQQELLKEGEVLKPAPKIFKETCRVHPQESAKNIHNKIRGLSPYPGAYVVMRISDTEQTEIKIFETEINPLHTGEPGTLHSDGKTYLAFNTSDKSINIKSLQSPGKKRLPIEEWLRGNKSFSLDWRVI
jgi:methionyl-tRNA formyltransferase